MAGAPKPVIWMGDSLEIVRGFPGSVKDEVGYALYVAQLGGKHASTKPLKGLGSGVLEVLSDYRGDTFRAVYTVRLAGKVYVLHALQKKSTQGVSMPQRDLNLVKTRLKLAEELHRKLEQQ